jgi:hypothetical protein
MERNDSNGGRMKTGLIYQPCGLGDILFLQKLAYHIKNLGYEVYCQLFMNLNG